VEQLRLQATAAIWTRIDEKSKLKAMKKNVFNLPLESVLGAAQAATQQAARTAVASGRVVTGWRDGQLVEYGVNALSLPPIASVEQGANARDA
jgi:hypothetical protein